MFGPEAPAGPPVERAPGGPYPAPKLIDRRAAPRRNLPMPLTADPPAPAADSEAGVLPPGLSKSQRAMLETGLRYVRSSLTMEMCEPASPTARERDAALGELEELENLLGMKPR